MLGGIAAALFVFNQRLKREIREREKAQKALRINEERQRLVLEASSEGIWDHNLATGEQYYSPAWKEILGYAPEELTPDHAWFLSMIHPDDRQRVISLIEEVTAGKRDQYRLEFRMRHRDGNWVWILSLGKAVERDATGGLVRVLGIHRDISERKRFEAELSTLSQAVEQSPASVVITDRNGDIEYVNPRFTEVTGYSREETAGQNTRILKSGNLPETYYKEMWETILSGKVWKGDLINKKKDGEEFWESSSISPIVNSDGEIIHLVAVKEDITERKRAEEELLKAKRLAETANQTKSDFLAAMSHEIRTPMNAVLGMTELTLKTELTVEQRDWLETVKESGEHLLGIIDNILDFSKVEAKKMVLDKVDYDLHESIRSVARAMQVQARRKSLFLKTEIAEDTVRYVVGDPGRLRQIMVNLVGNAIKFTEHGGVTIAVAPAEPGSLPIPATDPVVRFSVQDSGIGVPPAKQRAIFESFSQVDGSITRRYGGTGLGLAISKQLVELMGGEVRLHSTPGEGSVFSFTLGLEQGDPARTKTKTEQDIKAVSRSGLRLKVLLVEDNMANVKVATAFLNRLGHETVHAPTGINAISLLTINSFDLILMDVEMPEMDGVEATRRIRLGEAGEDKKDVPIIAMTAHAMAGAKDRLLAAGMDDYLPKPVDFHALATLLGEAALEETAPLATLEATQLADTVWDREGALDRFGNDDLLFQAVCADFLQDTPKKLEELRHAADETDPQAVLLLTHTLKANCGTVGANALRSVASTIEEAAKAERPLEIQSLLPVLDQEFEKARQSMTQ